MAKRLPPTQITLRRPTYGHLPETAKALAAKAKDLDALRTSVVDAATVGGTIWLSYLFTLFYLAIAAGAVTHKDLFFEHGVKLPFLNVELPLRAFFALGPALFLIAHLYMLLHFVLLAGKVGAFRTELEAQISDADSPGTKNAEIRTSLRRQLPSNVLVQFLAGPRDVRHGLMGGLLKLIAWFSLVIGPVMLLVFFQLQFLPYHDEAITWWHRLAVLLDIILLWSLWPAIARAEPVTVPWRGLRWTAVPLGSLSLVPLLLVFTVATFPGERWHETLPSIRFIPTTGELLLSNENGAAILDERGRPIASIGWRLRSFHEVLLVGQIDHVARRSTSPFSNVLVLPGLDAIDRTKFDSEAKISAARETISLRGRRLEGAVLLDVHFYNTR